MPGVKWEMEIVIHPTQKSLEKAYNSKGGESDDTVAFCDGGDRRKSIAARLHFTKKRMDIRVISHETFHAILFLSNHMKLDLTYGPSEEVMAETTEVIIAACLKVKRSK